MLLDEVINQLGRGVRHLDSKRFDQLYDRLTGYFAGRPAYVQDLTAGADPAYSLRVRVINEFAWHNLFVRALFVRPNTEEMKSYVPEFTIVSAPEFQANPQRDGTRTAG